MDAKSLSSKSDEPTPDVDLKDLVRLSRDKSIAGRTALADTVSDLFFGDRGLLSEQERAIMSDILRQLIHDVEMSVRKKLAERLSQLDYAPHDLVHALANDAIEVAHPILVGSDVLHDADLVEIIRHRTLEHQLAITLRKSLSEDVSDALVETGDESVIASLLKNSQAGISARTMEYLVEQSARVDSYRNPLVRRSDLNPELAKRMCNWVSGALRKHIIENFSIDPSELDDSIEGSVQDVLEGHDTDRKTSPTRELAQEILKSGDVAPEMLIDLLRDGEVSLFEAVLGKLTELRPTLLRRLIYEPGGEGLAIVCRATGMEKSCFASIFLLSRQVRPGSKETDAAVLGRVLDLYERIEPEAASAILKRWRRDPQYLDVLRQIEEASAAA